MRRLVMTSGERTALPVVPICRIPTGIAVNPKSERSSLRPAPASRPEWGIVEARHTGTNQRGELVFSMLAIAFVPQRKRKE